MLAAPLFAVGFTVVAHSARPTGPIIESASVECIEILADDAEQTGEVPGRPRRVRVAVNLRLFRFNQ